MLHGIVTYRIIKVINYKVVGISINTVARRIIIVSFSTSPTIEYGSEVLACSTKQTTSLEPVQLGAAK